MENSCKIPLFLCCCTYLLCGFVKEADDGTGISTGVHPGMILHLLFEWFPRRFLLTRAVPDLRSYSPSRIAEMQYCNYQNLLQYLCQ